MSTGKPSNLRREGWERALRWPKSYVMLWEDVLSLRLLLLILGYYYCMYY